MTNGPTSLPQSRRKKITLEQTAAYSNQWNLPCVTLLQRAQRPHNSNSPPILYNPVKAQSPHPSVLVYLSTPCPSPLLDSGQKLYSLPGASNLRSEGHTQPKTAMNAAQHKIINLLKTFFYSSVFVCVFVFNVWPKRALLLPVWPRDTKRLDSPAYALFPL